jgi:hypothetical protein
MNLFAYGTLMTPDGLAQALGERASSLRFRPARLAGWRRIWNSYREEWAGGVLNAEPRADSTIQGVLIEGLLPEDLARLDEQEKTHLPRQAVVVETDEGAVPADMYIARHPDYSGRPSARYLAIVLGRARQAGPAVLESVRTGTVDARGRPERLG